MKTQPVTSAMIRLLQKISAQFLLLSPARQRIIIRVKDNNTMSMQAVQLRRADTTRQLLEKHKNTVSFEALGLMIPPEYYNRRYLYDLNPDNDAYGKFQFFLMDADEDQHVDDSKFYPVKNIPAEAPGYYNERNIYVAAAAANGRT